MPFNRHVPIVAYDIDLALFNLAGWKIPTAGIANMRLFDGFGIDKECSVAKFNLLTLQGNNPFEQHHPISGKTHAHNVKSFRASEKVTQFKAEINPVIAIGGLHAQPFDQERRADMTEEEIRRKRNKANPDQEFKGQGWEKESTDSLMHLYFLRLKLLI
jgi:hypothetical protein